MRNRLFPLARQSTESRRAAVVSIAQSQRNDTADNRFVELLARGLERLLTAKSCEREGDADELDPDTNLDFFGCQSVTTQDQMRSIKGDQ